MQKKTQFVDIQELNEYMEVLRKGNVLLTNEEITELHNYICTSSLISPKDRERLLDIVSQVKSV